MQSNDRESFYDHYNNMGKPSKSEAETDSELRNREMAGDPMAEYMRQKKKSKQGSTNDKPVYSGQYPPNRFNIRPGYRWDGVNRSNGFEKRLLEKEASKKASEEESYRYATRDL